MDRRRFGQAAVAAAAGLGLSNGTAKEANGTAKEANGAAPRDASLRVFPDLPIITNDQIRVGGDYWIVATDKGFTSPESIDFFKRFNVRHLSARGGAKATAAETSRTSRTGDFLQSDGAWDIDRLRRMRDDCHEAGVFLEGIRMDSAYIVLKPGDDRDRMLDVLSENVRKAGEMGISLVGYHWTMIPIRRNKKVEGRGGSTYNGFQLETDYRSLPPTEAAGQVSLADYWERIEYFLKRLVPVAREAKVRLACHPYDPGGLPLGYQGVDNWDAGDFAQAMLKYEMLVDDVCNSFQYDTGVAAESMQDSNAQLGLIRHLAERGKLAQIHFRNVRGRQNDFVETYIDEGDINMMDCLRVLRDTGWKGSLLPDHVPDVPDSANDPHKLQSYAHAFGYIQGLLSAAHNEAVFVNRA